MRLLGGFCGACIADELYQGPTVLPDLALTIPRESGGPPTKAPGNAQPVCWLASTKQVTLLPSVDPPVTTNPRRAPAATRPLCLWVAICTVLLAASVLAMVYRPWAQPAQRWDLWRDIACAGAVGLLLGQWLDARRQLRGQRQTQRRATRQLTAAEEFLYIAAHDLKDPLRSMGYQLQLLDQDLRGGADPRRRVEALGELVGRSLRLVDDLLEFAATDEQRPQRDCVQLLTALDDAAARFTASHGADRVEIRWSGPPLAQVSGDHRLLVEVLANLLGNALKFTTSRCQPAGTVPGGQEADSPALIEVGVLPLAQPTLFVRDRGIGLPADADREAIFQPFRRLHGRRQYPGSGLGLSLVRRFVEAHGGRVWVEDTPGGGATFLFTLSAGGRPKWRRAVSAVPAPHLRKRRKESRVNP